ncbi:hypothetical protein [Psychrosphaera aestuarii]|uniref:hypothetical protein n=1 Tax=Psychrosphaera aestuarii TaxID=1266052 RepID=UPI001B32A875|nr:hypothetical protein [Psychrosphaera aestuarii]
MLYHILGAVSSILFLLTWYGLSKQLILINDRKSKNLLATENLSINQFASSFFAFYANFMFGIAIEPFNHYLVWTRFGALVLLIAILFRIYQERKGHVNAIVYYGSTFAFGMGLLSIGYRPFPAVAKIATDVLMLVVTLVLVQGTLHQYWLLHKSKSLGGLSFPLIKSILIKDVSTLAFALTLPLSSAWPLLTLNGMSIISRGILLIKMYKVNQ